MGKLTVYSEGPSVDVRNGASVPNTGTGKQITVYAEDTQLNTVVGKPPVEGKIRYRPQHRQLFQHIRSAYEPARIVGSVNYMQEGPGTAVQVGPTHEYVDKFTGWPWDRDGGDFIDANLARNPATPKPWFSVNLNKATGTTTAASYTVDVTAALDFIQKNDRWNALLLDRPRGTNGAAVVRNIAGKFSSTPPSISVLYDDLSMGTLACIVCAVNNGGSAYPIQTAAAMMTPVFVEFERPARAVKQATMNFRITSHVAGTASNGYAMNGYVIDPPLNHNPVEQGIAAAYTLDQGLAGNPAVYGQHAYVDGSTNDQFIASKTEVKLQNFDAEPSFDPAIWGRGPTDLTKLPHAGCGKWVGPAGDVANWDVIPSTFKEPGFEPLAPGIGAMRIEMLPEPHMTGDGVIAAAPAYGTANGKIFLPLKHWGEQEIYVRYYVRIGLSDDDTEFTAPIAKRYNYIKTDGVTKAWLDMGGKFGISPDHTTSAGGVSGSSGGGNGWMTRETWTELTAADTGPDTGGWFGGEHEFDFQQNNPPGYQYGSDEEREDRHGQIGGLASMMYAGHWYLVEKRLKLNTVRYPDGTIVPGGFLADGEIDFWFDGIKVFHRDGMVFRSLPYNYGGGYGKWPTDPGYIAGRLRPCYDLGMRSLWFDWYHGGTSPNARKRRVYLAQLLYGTKYFGPMRFG